MLSVNRIGDESMEDLEVLFKQIIDSEIFRAAPMMRNLLSYLWQHRKQPLSEYAIARDALGRRADFNPKIDATVRVEIARLRRKLKEYYDSREGPFPLLVSVPLGGHELHWIYSSSPDSISFGDPIVPKAAPRMVRIPLAISIGLACVGALLCFICAALLVQNRGLKASNSREQSTPRFWQSFIGAKPTSIVVPAPVHFFWPNQRVFIRDLDVSDFSDWSSSATLREFAKRWGPPQLDQRFVIARDVFAAGRLLQFLQDRGKQAQLIGSTNLSVDSSTKENIVFVGGPRTTDRFAEVLAKSNFQMAASNPTLIKNRHPKTGEPSEYQESVKSSERRTIPGIITLLPTRVGGPHTLVLVGRFSTALTSFLLSPDGLKLVDESWAKNGNPEAWEMVVQADVQGETPLKVWPVGFRRID
jgi:hypothetical protein